MTTSNGWTISVTDALSAYFKQPTGPSRPGSDWGVVVANGADQTHLLVRTYTDEVGALPPQAEAKLVTAYVAQLLDSGWTPANYRGEPGELVVPPQPGVTPPPQPAPPKRPWWRFW